MPFVSTKKKLRLTVEELSTLNKISHSRKESSSRVERAKVLLAYHEGENVSQIAKLYKTNRPKIERQINKALEIGAIAALNDLPRSGKSDAITDEARTWLVSLACTKPLDVGYSNETWTMSLLATHARTHCVEAGYPFQISF